MTSEISAENASIINSLTNPVVYTITFKQNTETPTQNESSVTTETFTSPRTSPTPPINKNVAFLVNEEKQTMQQEKLIQPEKLFIQSGKNALRPKCSYVYRGSSCNGLGRKICETCGNLVCSSHSVKNICTPCFGSTYSRTK